MIVNYPSAYKKFYIQHNKKGNDILVYSDSKTGVTATLELNGSPKTKRIMELLETLQIKIQNNND